MPDRKHRTELVRAAEVSRWSDSARGLAIGLGATVRGAALDVVEVGAALAGTARAIRRGELGGALAWLGRAGVRLLQIPLDAALMTGGATLSAGQTLLGLEAPGRRLTARERGLLEPIFRHSLELDAIRVKEGSAGLLTLPRRPFVLGNTIFVPPGWLPLSDVTLVHEAVHVWQHQHGGTDYMSESLWAQYFGEGYDLARGLGARKTWAQLNPEQQAELIAAGFARGYFADPTRPVIVDGIDRSADFLSALTELRHGRGSP